jgi:hypothetical protein
LLSREQKQNPNKRPVPKEMTDRLVLKSTYNREMRSGNQTSVISLFPSLIQKKRLKRNAEMDYFVRIVETLDLQKRYRLINMGRKIGAETMEHIRV